MGSWQIGGSRLVPGIAAAAGLLLGARWAARAMRARRATLAGQVAVVTGGSRGLGYLIARELVREGCRVVICARYWDDVERARQRLLDEGADVLAMTCDVSDSAQAERLISDTIDRFGRVDILVNNAGIIQVAPVQAMGIADFQRAMAVNFWGTVHATLAALPSMRSRRAGRIVNITSIGGKVAVPHLLPYDCAKFAAVGFSEGLRVELARDGVTVTTVVPGLMRTGSHRFATFKGKADSEYGWFSVAATTPGLAMSAARAARQIVRAMKLGDAEPVLGVPARALRLVKELFPAMTLGALALTNRLLPDAGPGEAEI